MSEIKPGDRVRFGAAEGTVIDWATDRSVDRVTRDVTAWRVALDDHGAATLPTSALELIAPPIPPEPTEPLTVLRSAKGVAVRSGIPGADVWTYTSPTGTTAWYWADLIGHDPDLRPVPTGPAWPAEGTTEWGALVQVARAAFTNAPVSAPCDTWVNVVRAVRDHLARQP